MNGQEFVEAIKRHVRDSSITDTIEFVKKPPGRRPRKKHVELSNWFNSLSDNDKRMVEKIMEEAVDLALFGALCVIDGVRTIEDTDEKTEFQLVGIKGNKSSLINNQKDMDLHDIYNDLTNPVD
jgi:hypothetical protein